MSGAAYRITAHGAYHHGTLLINADLPRLRQYLAAPAVRAGVGLRWFGEHGANATRGPPGAVP